MSYRATYIIKNSTSSRNCDKEYFEVCAGNDNIESMYDNIESMYPPHSRLQSTVLCLILQTGVDVGTFPETFSL